MGKKTRLGLSEAPLEADDSVEFDRCRPLLLVDEGWSASSPDSCLASPFRLQLIFSLYRQSITSLTTTSITAFITTSADMIPIKDVKVCSPGHAGVRIATPPRRVSLVPRPALGGARPRTPRLRRRCRS